ncbi:MAG: hypothetical protein U9Q74_03085 [Gemmatimonadota bacterium]|nr:hypothetical protein [Gemmatimonadota bacterium]
MHRIGVIGITWRHRRPDLLSALTIAKDQRVARLPALRAAARVDELVYIATCGRVEVAFAAEGDQSVEVVRRRLYAALAGQSSAPAGEDSGLRAWRGEGAVEHLFLVTSGLDSARIGESEVLGQVRDAVEQAREAGTCGPLLHRVFDEALRTARRVRPLTEGRVGAVSLAQIAAGHAARRVGRTGGSVAVVGVSPMTEACAVDLAARGIPVIVVNRTPTHAEPLAARVGGRVRSLGAFRASPDPVEALVVATGATEGVFRRGDLERLAARATSGSAPLVVDLGVPPNVTPADARAADVRRVGMDDIQAEAEVGRERLRLEFADARAVVDEALLDFRRHDAERMVGGMIARLRLQYRHTAMEGVDRLFARALQSLDEGDRAAVRQWAETLAGRMAHIPTVGLRELAVELGPGAVETFFSASPSLRDPGATVDPAPAVARAS